ncbi:MAG TPA: OPT/YSL family transporter, partial [Pseudobdellovibrionaceae bacterium]|nr:OPT/YSL family transporter [Pseudobdellovibrionaceae bacterium]
MSIHELSEEQIHTLSLKEKDEWWLKEVYKGEMPQLNLRSALTGMILGGVLSLTNLYVGIKTGWTLGVGISSVILSFALFKLLAKLKIGQEMSILENNAMQSIATSAGYMTAPLMASMPAYMMVTGQVIPMWQTFWWIVCLALLGVLFAFPL